jgi:hypothetical protein
MPEIDFVEKDYIREVFLTWVITNDPLSIEQWHHKMINNEEAWEIYNDLENKTIVSVIDTWIDYTHPDLVWNLKDLSSNCYSDTWILIWWWCKIMVGILNEIENMIH